MVATATQSLVGIGLYSVPEAARLLSVPVRKLRRWAVGHSRSHGGEERFDPPVIHCEIGAVDATPILTFTGLMELQFVAVFRRHGVSLPIIRAAADVAGRMFDTDHPFAVRRFDTDGNSIFATLGERDYIEGLTGQELTQELHRSQYVFGHFVKPFFKRLDYAGNEIERYWPQGRRGRVVIDPRRAFGRPIDAETGVPTHALYQATRSGDSTETVAAWYEVPVEAVEAAVEYERFLDEAA